MRKLLVAFIVLGVAVFAIPNAANAVPMTGWDGSVLYTGAENAWTATVYYRVYAPNQSDAPGIGDIDYYSYFYRLENTSASGSSTLKFFTVGNPYRAPIIEVNTTDYNSGIAPVTWGDAGDSLPYAWWTSGTDRSIPRGQYNKSDWVYYTTPTPPGWVIGSLQNGGAAQTSNVPGPAPEPGTMAMLGLGLMAFAGSVIRKKFRA